MSGDDYERRSYGAIPVDFQLGFTDPQYPLGVRRW